MGYLLGEYTGSGRVVIPKELYWMEYRNSLALDYGSLHSYTDIETVIQNGGLRQSDLEMLGCSTKGIKL
ncbi:MAG: hypothetical protein ACOC6R_00085 [Chloroflexota bacterium]